jgi:hypothetical protein
MADAKSGAESVAGAALGSAEDAVGCLLRDSDGTEGAPVFRPGIFGKELLS